MLQFELQLEHNEIEKFSIFNTDLVFELDVLDEQDRQIYLNILDLINNDRLTIMDTPNINPIIIFRMNSFNHNSDMSISDEYPIINSNFLEYSDSDQLTITKFIDLINRLQNI